MIALHAAAPLRDSHSAFWDFVELRPDEEKWELIEGQFVMQAQPSLDHQIIAGTLDRLLNDGLERVNPDRIALQNPAIDLRPAVTGHTYVPDVAVIDLADVEPGRNVTPHCYLAAEILSPSDRRKLSGTSQQKIAVKLAGYEALPMCEAVLLIEQRSFAATLSERRDGAWHRRTLGADDRLVLPGFGLDCALGDLYARTALARAQRRN